MGVRVTWQKNSQGQPPPRRTRCGGHLGVDLKGLLEIELPLLVLVLWQIPVAKGVGLNYPIGAEPDGPAV